MLFTSVQRQCRTRIPLRALSKIAETKRDKNDIQIIVIGAGLAGLSAASHLLHNGYTRTLLLEATDRYGGRVDSIKLGDSYCELGAKWVAIDGSKNSTYELLKRASTLQKRLLQQNEVFYVNSDGEKVTNKKISEAVHTLFAKLSSGGELKEKLKTGNLPSDLNNVQSYFSVESDKLVQSVFTPEEQATAKDIFSSLIKEYGGMLGCCLDYVNIEHLMKMNTFQSNSIYIPTGLDGALRHLAAFINPINMKTGKPVGEIHWLTSPLDAKTVHCMDGSSFIADHIICTLPLGVLKSFSENLFKPRLPVIKRRAIKNLGFGDPLKIYFEYDDNIKPWFTANIRPLWNSPSSYKNVRWIKQVVEISKLPSSKRVLEIQIGGGFFEQIEKLPDTELVEQVTSILRSCLRKPEIPYPATVLRSSWGSSACFLGGRPYFALGSTSNDVQDLAAPLGELNSLLFAGDATTLEGFGTINGARLSGIREAQRIIDLYTQIPLR